MSEYFKIILLVIFYWTHTEYFKRSYWTHPQEFCFSANIYEFSKSSILDSIFQHNFFEKDLSPLFIDGVQLSQSYRTTTRRQFTFYHLVPRISWYSFDRPRKDARLSRPWSHLVVLQGSLVWESSVLTTRPLLHI